MKGNVGGTDRILRVVVGVVLLATAILTKQTWALIGLVPFLTGVLGWCPAYLPLGFSSNRSA